MWAAHALTCSRIGFAIAFWLSYDAWRWAALWVLVAALSDALDGRVARWARRRTGVPEHAPSIGDWLDPVVDKAFVVIALTAVGAHVAGAWPMLACLAARELAVVPILGAYAIARARGRAPARRLRARPLGKAATVTQFVGVVALVAPVPALRWPLAIVTAVLGVAAVVEQLVHGRASASAP